MYCTFEILIEIKNEFICMEIEKANKRSIEFYLIVFNLY